MSEVRASKDTTRIQNIRVDEVEVGDVIIVDPIMGREVVVSIEKREMTPPIDRYGYTKVTEFYVFQTKTPAVTNDSGTWYPRWFIRSSGEPIILFSKE